MNRDHLLNLDTGESIQGHVGDKTKQTFDLLMTNPFCNKKLKLDGFEFLMRDQFGNHYFKMRAVLFDGEMYDVDQYIKPSMMMKTGGGFADLEDKVAKTHLRITEHLLADLREHGAMTLARTNIQVMKAKAVSNAPIAIETKDITHQSNQLEQAIKVAKTLAGDIVKECSTPEGFVPLKATPPEAEIIPFPGLHPIGDTPKERSHELFRSELPQIHLDSP